MNVQTEQLENHKLRLTVRVEEQRLEDAKRKAAKRIARQVRIPGFRKGKAPYAVLVRHGFEAQIVNDAIEDLSQSIYRETLEQAQVEPYGPGDLEDIQLEDDAPTFVYTVPMQPTVTLGDYRAIRLPYEVAEATDEEVDKALAEMQKKQAVIEVSSQPAKIGDRLNIDIHAVFNDEPPETDDEEFKAKAPAKGIQFAHGHDETVLLDPDDEPFIPGFVEAVVGAGEDDELDFELTIPEDEDIEDYVWGRKIHFNVVVNQVETVTLPPLNDDFAAQATADEDEPLTLLQLRLRVREQLQAQLEEDVRRIYEVDVIDAIVERSEFAFPDAMVDDQIDNMIEELQQMLSQQGLDLETYLRVMGKTEESLREDYQESAKQVIRRSLAIREVVKTEQLQVTDDMISKRIDDMVAQFGEQAASFRAIFDSPQMRSNMASEMMNKLVFDRIVAIAKGEDVPEPGDLTADDAAGSETVAELPSEVQSDVEEIEASGIEEELDSSLESAQTDKSDEA